MRLEPARLNKILQDIFSVAMDTADCFQCKEEVSVLHRFCPRCGYPNPLHAVFLPFLTEEEKELVRLDCTDIDHKNLAAMEPEWTTCYACGAGLWH